MLGPDAAYFANGWEPEDYWKAVVERRLLITSNNNVKTEEIITDSEYDDMDPNFELVPKIKRER
jgi:hypothetical protein